MTTSATQRRARTPQTERVETTQRKIIDSALALLREGGFKSATLQAIARGADVSLGALQHHFESRDALMERLVIEVMEPLSDQGTVWPDKALPLRERAQAFVTLAWDHIFGAANYQAAWSMFFGCKASPTLFGRVDARRVQVDGMFYARFLDVFPEVREHHPHPQGVAAMAFATLRGIGVLELFSVEQEERQCAFSALVESIVDAGTPRCPQATQAAPAPKKLS